MVLSTVGSQQQAMVGWINPLELAEVEHCCLCLELAGVGTLLSVFRAGWSRTLLSLFRADWSRTLLSVFRAG